MFVIAALVLGAAAVMSTAEPPSKAILADPSEAEAAGRAASLPKTRRRSGETSSHSAEATKLARAELRTQERIATYTFWMTFVAAAQAIIAAGGIWFVWHTLKATRDSVRESAGATDAARKSLELAAATSAAQLRPYVYLERVEFFWRSDKSLFDLMFHFKNFGATPAIAYGIQTSWRHNPPGVEGFADQFDPKDEEPNLIIPPGHSRRSVCHFPDSLKPAFAEVMAGHGYFLSRARVEYYSLDRSTCDVEDVVLVLNKHSITRELPAYLGHGERKRLEAMSAKQA